MVMTVMGELPVHELGVTLPHEHLLIDLRNQFHEPDNLNEKYLARQRLDLHNVALVRHNPYAIRDNLLLDDLQTAIKEAGFFKEAGGKTIIDCTSIGICRQPRKLQKISQATGLNIVAGCGYYTADTHPLDMADKSVEELRDSMLQDLLVGIEDSRIRAGIIGELGTSKQTTCDESKVLLAAAKAFAQCAVPIFVHTYPWAQEGLNAAMLLLDHGVAPDKIVICHADVQLNRQYILKLLSLGVWVEFDNFGKQFSGCADNGFAGGQFGTDNQRVHEVIHLVNKGFQGRLLLSNDICLKSMLHCFGGTGYDFTSIRIKQMVCDLGGDIALWNQLTQANPASLLNNLT